jgi:Mrp family chromosome partitioning ATPase
MTSSSVAHATAELQGLVLTLLGMPGPRTIFVTSARASEGKTFVSVALARLAATMSRERVLLVDANFQRPALAERLGCGDVPGFSDALEAGTLQGLEPCATDLRNLRVMPAGRCADPALLFQPAAMNAVLADLCSRSDLVILDGSTTWSAGAIAACATGTIFVADCVDTRREAASGALGRLKMPRERMLGAVLNRKRYPIPHALYRRL